MSDPIRLDKCVADLLRCPRAEAQQYVEGGWVSVDGEVVDESQAMVDPLQVTVDPAARPEAIEPATILLHKPVGIDTRDSAALVTPETHSEDDPSEVRMLKRHFHRLTPLMPLDSDASGMLVLSQDGRTWRRLTEDYASIEQEFVVEVAGELARDGLHRLALGRVHAGRALPPCKVSWQNETRLRFAIKDVQPGQLRQMCGDVGLEVVTIKRIRIGRISLGKMPVGEWRYVAVGGRF